MKHVLWEITNFIFMSTVLLVWFSVSSFAEETMAKETVIQNESVEITLIDYRQSEYQGNPIISIEFEYFSKDDHISSNWYDMGHFLSIEAYQKGNTCPSLNDCQVPFGNDYNPYAVVNSIKRGNKVITYAAFYLLDSTSPIDLEMTWHQSSVNTSATKTIMLDKEHYISEDDLGFHTNENVIMVDMPSIVKIHYLDYQISEYTGLPVFCFKFEYCDVNGHLASTWNNMDHFLEFTVEQNGVDCPPMKDAQTPFGDELNMYHCQTGLHTNQPVPTYSAFYIQDISSSIDVKIHWSANGKNIYQNMNIIPDDMHYISEADLGFHTDVNDIDISLPRLVKIKYVDYEVSEFMGEPVISIKFDYTDANGHVSSWDDLLDFTTFSATQNEMPCERLIDSQVPFGGEYYLPEKCSNIGKRNTVTSFISFYLQDEESPVKFTVHWSLGGVIMEQSMQIVLDPSHYISEENLGYCTDENSINIVFSKVNIKLLGYRISQFDDYPMISLAFEYIDKNGHLASSWDDILDFASINVYQNGEALDAEYNMTSPFDDIYDNNPSKIGALSIGVPVKFCVSYYLFNETSEIDVDVSWAGSGSKLFQTAKIIPGQDMAIGDTGDETIVPETGDADITSVETEAMTMSLEEENELLRQILAENGIVVD